MRSGTTLRRRAFFSSANQAGMIYVPLRVLLDPVYQGVGGYTQSAGSYRTDLVGPAPTAWDKWAYRTSWFDSSVFERGMGVSVYGHRMASPYGQNAVIVDFSDRRLRWRELNDPGVRLGAVPPPSEDGPPTTPTTKTLGYRIFCREPAPAQGEFVMSLLRVEEGAFFAGDTIMGDEHVIGVRPLWTDEHGATLWICTV